MRPELYQHQKEAIALANGKKAFALFCEMGTGKSAIIIHETINLIERDRIDSWATPASCPAR